MLVLRRDVTYQIQSFPPRKILVSDIPAGDGHVANPFYSECPFPGLSNRTTLEPILSGQTVPLNLEYFQTNFMA